MRRNNFITLNKMRDITTSILDRTGYPLQWNGSIQAVPIEDIIEFDFDIEWNWGNINHLSDGCAMAALYPKEKEIILNVSCKDLFKEKFGTMMFTLAHELGHWVLHIEDVTNMQISLFEDGAFYCRSHQNKSPIEYQADLFAGCLLMPEEILSPLIHDLLNKNSGITWRNLYNIAKDFEVSISALTTRLQQLKLVYIDSNKVIHNSKEEAMGQQRLF